MNHKHAFLLLLLIVCSSDTKPNLNNPIIKKFKNNNHYGIQDGNIRKGDAGNPVILTDLINQGKIEEAQQAAEVKLVDFLGVKSYSGFLTVDETYNSNLFFWFFPSQSNYETDPVVMWLQGGPGSSSMFGLFQENGPFVLNEDIKVELSNTSWTTSNSVLYFDQPAGTGFSFTSNGYAKNQTKVGEDLYKALIQFFKLFPNLQSNDFFATGESYAGKYVPAIGHAIWQNNPSADLKINLQGLAIGNGWSVPEVQLKYAEYLYQHGLIDLNTKNDMDDLENQAVQLIQQRDYAGAEAIMNRDFGGLFSQFSVATGFQNVYNYLKDVDDSAATSHLYTFFGREDVRRAIHVGNVPFDDSNEVYNNLEEDIPKSVAPLLTDLINNYRVLLYNGQLDLIVPYPLTVKYLQSLDFNGAEEYKTAFREIWFYGGGLSVIAGYVKTAGNLTEVLVRNAGHMVPADQPEWALELINKFVRNEPFGIV